MSAARPSAIREPAPTSADVVAAARAYLGVPWSHQGRGVGEHPRLDCVGLIIRTARDLHLRDREGRVWGDTMLDVQGYNRRPDGSTLQALLRSYLEECHQRQLRQGRIAAFCDVSEAAPCHVGILTDRAVGGGVGLIHASAHTRKVVEHGLSRDWLSKLRAVYRFPLVLER